MATEAARGSELVQPPAAGDPARAGGRGAPPARAPLSLESNGNTVTTEAGFLRRFEISPCGCDCWFCDQCSVGKGLRLRAELMPILESFQGLLLVSLTVDPLLFPSPKAAFLYMADRRCVSRTVQDLRRRGCLHSRRYFYVVEWQAKTEQAHFHVLLDASFVPFASLLGSWSKHRPESAGPVPGDRPAFGTVFISKPQFDGGAPHAARYVTKYLTKPPRGGLPAWVLDMGTDRLIRRYSASRGFWGRAARARSEGNADDERERASYKERIADCGRAVKVCSVDELVSPQTGEVVERRTWLGELGVRAEVLARIDDGGSPRRRRRAVVAESAAAVAEQVSAVAGFPVPWLRRAYSGGC